MKTGSILLFCVLVAALPAAAWIDYADAVPDQEPRFGREFAGIALTIHSAKTSFEQEEAVTITIELQNASNRTTLLPDTAEPGERQTALYIVLANKNGDSLFSQDLLPTLPGGAVAAERIPPQDTRILLEVSFAALNVATVTEYRHGAPWFDPLQRRIAAGNLTPQVFTLKAILLSFLPGKRPDFVVASEPWRILLLPKSVQRMTPEEKERKMTQYLEKLAQGAYGGIGVSSQLAAFGDEAVPALIAMADTPGDDTVRESRIWAIVTLCNTHSARAEAYILRRLEDPVAFGDLAFLAWHSQGFKSPRVTAALTQFCENVVAGKPMPWETTHGPESRVHGRQCLEFAFKHLAAIDQSITDATAAALPALENPKILAFGLSAWKPTAPAPAGDLLRRLVLRTGLHPNVKRAALHAVAGALAADGMAPYDRDVDVELQWLAAILCLGRSGRLDRAAQEQALENLVLALDKENAPAQEALILALKRLAPAGLDLPPGPLVLPEHWTATWRWALNQGHIPKQERIAFLCRYMRTRDPIADSIRRALLLELKHALGPGFPLQADSGEAIDLDADWPTCGEWLLQQGYFGDAGGRAN